MSADQGSPGVRLRRVLSLSDLVIYGIILIQPVAPMALFGLANRDSAGHAVTAILLAMIAIAFTAVSYGRMASHYPAAGSAYTYVGRGLNPHLGFIAGYTMFLDYMIVPIICTIYAGIAAHHMVPAVPARAWFAVFAFGFTFLNLRGIKATSRVNWGLMIVMSAVVFWFMAAAVRYLLLKGGAGALFTTEPFYHESSFSWPVIGRGTALAALTYIGFDGLTTLSEEVENPRRNILLAAVLTCLITGIWSGAQVYLAQAVVPWSEWEGFLREMAAKFGAENAIEKAMIGVADIAGGGMLEFTLAFILLVAHIGSSVAGMTGASRILYGMGRDGILPQRFFGHLSERHAVPSYNIILIGAITLAGSNLLTYDICAHLINFGAFLAFMLVNAASIREYYFKFGRRTARSLLKNFLPPAAGLAACLAIWLSLPRQTFILGGSWMLVGIAYLAVRTKGFREKLEVRDIF
ncbi:MAG: APC family permease [Candidatus Glassbacteria bacterium]|nr:APC family permease [Candidatus Glassbacteria bacterium]